jgi:hypothetical protein
MNIPTEYNPLLQNIHHTNENRTKVQLGKSKAAKIKN